MFCLADRLCIAITANTERSNMIAKRKQKVVRVFISSVFREFETERKILAGSIFPKLRDRFSVRGISIVSIDLRWGLESNQIEESGLVDACLSQVVECNPYFLGLLGSRYGTVVSPEELNESRLLKSHLVEESFDGPTSITELEFQIGALQDHNEYALFFSKNTPEGRDQRTASLLDKVVSCGAVPVDYDSLECFESVVFDKLVDLINRRFPDDTDELSPEAAAQEAVLGQHTDLYIPGSPVVNKALSRLRRGKTFTCREIKAWGKAPPCRIVRVD